MKVKLYHTYSHRGQDPAVAALLAAQDEVGMKQSEVSKESNVSTGTLGRWRSKKTQRPQFCTLVATARAIGPKGITALVEVIRRGK